jgi:hypothetical protein
MDQQSEYSWPELGFQIYLRKYSPREGNVHSVYLKHYFIQNRHEINPVIFIVHCADEF